MKFKAQTKRSSNGGKMKVIKMAGNFNRPELASQLENYRAVGTKFINFQTTVKNTGTLLSACLTTAKALDTNLWNLIKHNESTSGNERVIEN